MSGFSVWFEVPGPPQGKGRARSARRRKRDGTEFIAHITPERTVAYESLIATAASQAMGSVAPYAGPVRIALAIYHPLPASWSNRRKERARSGAIVPARKPDADNVLKAIGDACNGIVWKDDRQVSQWRGACWFSDRPRVEVSVEHVAYGDEPAEGA